MNAVPHERGLAFSLPIAPSLDPDTATARDRLDAALGPELAHMLVFALSGDESASTLGRGAG